MIECNSLINEIFNCKSDFSNPEQAQDMANSLELLSSDIYTDSKRFIYELLQNADDASNVNNKLEMEIRIIEDYLVISHQGEPFSKVDIESVCSVGDGNKDSDDNKTGFKGVGFKSVFNYSNYIVISTLGYCFRFDKSNWKNYWNDKWGLEKTWISIREQKGKPGLVKMPWQIIPIWTEIDPRFKFTKKFKVATIIRHNNIEKLQRDIIELFSNTQILLFLRCPEVSIKIIGTDLLVLEKIKADNIVQLRKNGSKISEWFLQTYFVDIDSKTKSQLESDTKIPRKLREASKAEFSFSFRMENGRVKSLDKEERLVFAYLPTSVNFDFPFLVNANFITDTSRQHLNEELSWNAWLFMQIPLLLFRWFSELALTYRFEILHLIPDKFVPKSDLEKSFNVGFNLAIESIAFIPNISGRLLKVSEAFLDNSRISNFVSKDLLVEYINKEYVSTYNGESFIKVFENLRILKRLGVRVFGTENLENFFSSCIFKKSHKIDENYDLMLFLQKQSELYDVEQKKEWLHKLKTTPFIFDENKILRCPKSIYFPSIEFEDEFSDSIQIVNSKAFIQINKNKSLKIWLENLGVKEPSNMSFIEKTIIEDDDFITTDNAVSVVRYLFNAYRKAQLTEDHLNDLKSIKVLTKENNLIIAQSSFLSDFFLPELLLESVYDEDLFISEDYFDEGDLKSEWKSFLIKIGVAQNISLVKSYISSSDAKEKYDSFKEFFSTNATQEYKAKSNNQTYTNPIVNYNLLVFTLFENTIHHSFSKLFWHEAFKIKFTRNSKDLGYAISGWHDAPQLKENFTEWCLKNGAVFPTTQGNCLRAEEVFINSASIKEIAGQYLPVLDQDEVISEDWVRLLSFKKLLEIDDYLRLLTSVSKDTSIDENGIEENKQRIESIYQNLANNYLGYSERLEKWGKENKLLAKDGKSFFSPTDLSIVSVEGFNAKNLAFCDTKSEGVIELLKIFGVTIIDKIRYTISNSSVEIADLKKQLMHVLPLIALVAVEKSRDKNDWQSEYNKLKKKLSDIKFFETTSITLSYGNEEDKLKRSSWAKDKEFFYVGKWYKPRVLDSLIEPIGKFLSIRYAERHLTVLLSDSFAEGLEYLKERFGEDVINLIPQEFINPEEPLVSQPNKGNREYNQSDEDLGKQGELFVFEELKRIFSNKYIQEIEETKKGFRIGNVVEVIWRNKEFESKSDHDFQVIESGKKLFIDSKATPYDLNEEKTSFKLSAPEFKLMESQVEYYVARVFKVTSEPQSKYIKLAVKNIID